MCRPTPFPTAALLAALALAACGDRSGSEAASAPVLAGSSIASAASSITAAASAPAAAVALASYLRGAEIQAENDAQRDELRRALGDLQSMSAAELRAARYAGADGKPAQRDVVQVLRAHLVPATPQGLDLDQLLGDRETEAGRTALRETAARLGPAPK